MSACSRRTASKMLAFGAVSVPVASLAKAAPHDPVVALYEQWREARSAYDRENERVKAIEATIPEDVRRYDGVFLGWLDLGGRIMPIQGRMESLIDSHFDKRLKAYGRVDVEAIERERAEALATLRRERKNERDAYRRAGMPHTPDDVDEYWGRWFDAYGNLELDIVKTPATTTEGAILKLMIVLALERLEQDPVDIDNCEGNSYRERLALSAAHDLERFAAA